MYDKELDIGYLVYDFTLLRIAIGASKSVNSRIMGCGLPKPSNGDNDCGDTNVVTLSFILFCS